MNGNRQHIVAGAGMQSCPRSAVVGRLQNAAAGSCRKDRVRSRGSQRKVANVNVRLRIGQWYPVCSAIGRLPDSASIGTDVDDIGVAWIYTDPPDPTGVGCTVLLDRLRANRVPLAGCRVSNAGQSSFLLDCLLSHPSVRMASFVPLGVRAVRFGLRRRMLSRRLRRMDIATLMWAG